MSARELEQLDQFKDFGPSTIRKRVSELSQTDKPPLYLTDPLIVAVDKETRSGSTPCTTWRVAA